MTPDDTQNFFDSWDQCAELYGKSVSSDAKELAFKLLVRYSLTQVKQALQAHMLDPDGGRFMPKPADVVSKIQAITPNGFPGAQEAWAKFPRDESQSACICDEMSVAWGIACELDKIAGRMAFIESYQQGVELAKAQGRPPRWYITRGSDKDQAQRVTLDAVRDRRLSPQAAKSYLEHIPSDDLIRLAEGAVTTTKLIDGHAQTVTNMDQLLLESDSKAEPEEVQRHLSAMRKVLGMAS